MIREALSGDEDELDCSFCPKSMLPLAVATSIDALAVGISFTCIGFTTLQQILFPLFAIGIASFIFAFGGCFIGSLLGSKLKFPMEPFGGLVLIILGVKILCEHLI